jgi:hypothetical protein
MWEDNMSNHIELENRIRDRAHRIWLDAGCPEGQAEHHWELARLSIVEEEGRPSAVAEPLVAPSAERTEAIANQAQCAVAAAHAEAQLAGPTAVELAVPAPAARKARGNRTTRKN